MPTYKIRGINVDFPYEAYDCQLVYMEKVIQSLQEKCNALLESPTGTGKTLCLLCATLAWRKSLGGFSQRRIKAATATQHEQSNDSDEKSLPTIIYASRTHSQLKQVVRELKRTNYRPKMVVLGSREQYCIHEKVSLLRGKIQTTVCRSLCRTNQKKSCAYYKPIPAFMSANPNLGDEPIDIEDVVNIGRTSQVCPYYVSRELRKVGDILFAPYNYLIDREYRNSLNIEWSNSILIFDEAHNLESICADAASFDLPSWLLRACISEAKECVDISTQRRGKLNDKSCNPEKFAILSALLLKLEKRIAEVPIEHKELGFTRPGPYIYELLAELNITAGTANMLIDTIEEAILLLEERVTGDKGTSQRSKETDCRLEVMCGILRVIFIDEGNSHSNSYRVHIQDVEATATNDFKGKPSRTLSWWCFSPGIAMQGFLKLGVGSIILTSGTLSPMDSFAIELKLQFPIRLENPHVITEKQIWAGIVPVGPSGFSFNSSYRSRDSIEYKHELGNAIVNFSRIVPDGLLIFFPSYYLLDQCIACWKTVRTASSITSSSIWERICKYKQPVVEPRQSSLFSSSINDFMIKLKDTSTSGAVFFAVCRGKVSEGLDFSDHAGRAVVVTGMPFATWTDPKVRLKREYLDQDAEQKTGKILTGEEWYSQQASRAVNQAVGRVIRHRHDYGAIIFCDERFLQSNRQSQVSLWIRPHLKSYSRFGDVVFTLTRFFREEGIPEPMKLQLLESDNQGAVKSLKSTQHLPKLQFEKLLAPLNAAMDPNCSLGSLSSEVEVRRGDISQHLGEVLPANRSSLTSCVQSQTSSLQISSDLFSSGKKMLLCGRKSAQRSNQKLNDLTNEESREELIPPYSLKKRKLPEAGSLQNSEDPYIVNKARLDNPFSIIHSEKTDTSLISGRGSGQGAQNSAAVLSNHASHDDVEERGSKFLRQVHEKLTREEYKEFMELLKALKCKTMRIGHVLQAVVRLFSASDRTPLRQRFRDVIPPKYHSLYEQCLKTNAEAIGLESTSMTGI